MFNWRNSKRIVLVAATVLLSCQQNSPTKPEAVEPERVNSIRRYVYADADGKRVIIYNSVPKGGGFTDSTGRRLPYTVFYTQVINGTGEPINLNIDFPLDSQEVPASSGNFLKLMLPSDEMTLDKVPLYDYGLDVQTIFNGKRPAAATLNRTIAPNDSMAFYVLTSSNRGVDGALRTGFSLKGQQLVYKVAVFKSAPGHLLAGEREINAGSISSSDLTLQK